MKRLVVNFYANISEHTVRDMMNWITGQVAVQKSEDPYVELILQISSSGGSSDHGLLAYNFLRQLNIPKTTIGMGNVDSAAALLFAAGDKRIATSSCRFVLHESRATVQGEFNATKLLEMANLTKRITDDYVDVIVKVTGKTKRSIAKKVNDGVVLSSGEAKALNFVTETTDDPYIKEIKELSILMVSNPQQPPTVLRPDNQQTLLEV